MGKLATLAVMAIMALAFALPAGATIINLNGDKAIDYSNEVASDAVKLALGPGTYEVTFTEDEYTAFNRWSASSGCDANGGNCRRGWENSAYVQIGVDWDNHFLLGNGGGYGPIADGGYFDSAADSLAHAAGYSYRFTLNSATDVFFYIGDDNLGDNNGGVSLLVRSVPAPAGWLLSLAGFGMIGLLLARRRKVGTPLAS